MEVKSVESDLLDSDPSSVTYYVTMSKSHTLFQCQFPHLQNVRSNTNNTYLVGGLRAFI